MFGTLIESRPLRQRRPGSAALSAVIHLGLVASAVGATLPHAPKAPPPVAPHDTIVWADPGSAVSRPHDGPISRCDPCFAAPPLPQIPTDPVPVTTGPALHVNFDSLFTTTNPGLGSKTGSLVDNPYARGGGVGTGTEIFTTNQVERAVAVLGTVRPAYPEMLRATGIEGRVVVRFIVDTAGRVEPGSITTIDATHALFEQSVRDALPRLRFAPAEVGGRHVRQLVEMPFQFSLSDR